MYAREVCCLIYISFIHTSPHPTPIPRRWIYLFSTQFSGWMLELCLTLFSLDLLGLVPFWTSFACALDFVGRRRQVFISMNPVIADLSILEPKSFSPASFSGLREGVWALRRNGFWRPAILSSESTLHSWVWFKGLRQWRDTQNGHEMAQNLSSVKRPAVQ